MVNKVLLIEDDIKISDLVKDSLLDEGYVVDQAFDGEEGYFKILENQPDLIILDIMIPKMNGFKVCAKVREHGVMSPILMLTAKSGEYDVEEGLDTGANDYLKKPFSMIELLARVRKLLKKDIAPTNTLEFQDLKIDLAARKATHNKLEIELTRQEFDLLSYLLENSGNVLTKKELLEEIWDILQPTEEDVNKVEVYIGYLRKKLKPFNLDVCINTVRGFGYRWNWLKNIGIRTKIISITLLFLGIGLFIAPGVLVDIAELRFKQVIEEGSDKLVEELKEDYQNLEPLESQRFIPYFVLVYDKQNGKLISQYSFFPPNLIDDYDPQSNKFSENLTDLNFIKTESNDKKVDIVVGFSESTPSEIINGIERIFIVIYILASLLVIVGILISIQIALKPVDKSIKKIEKLDPLNKLEKLDEVASNDEIGNLISTFNSLLEKVNISSISQKQFISNASHELKTPLTSLKLQIEKLSVLNGVDEEMIKNIQEDINEIQSTLEALLDLENSGSNTEGSEEVLVNDLIKGVVVGTDVIFQDKKEIKIFSNSNVIKLMLNNLIGNAENLNQTKL